MTAAALQVAIKFYPEARLKAFRHECLFYENRVALEPETADYYTPRRLDAFVGSNGILTEQTTPSALVLARGDFTLQVLAPSCAPCAPCAPCATCARHRAAAEDHRDNNWTALS